MGGGCCIGDNPFFQMIKDGATAIGDAISGIFCSDSGCGYHPRQVNNADDARNVANEIAEIQKKQEGPIKKDEEKILGYLEKSLDRLLREVERVNSKAYGGKTLYLNIKGIREQQEKLRNEVIGFMSSEMNKRLVPTDKEFSLLLQNPNDEERGKAFDSFYKEVRSASIKTLSEKIQQTMKKQQKMIEEEVLDRLNEIDSAMQKKEDDYRAILQSKEKAEKTVAEERAKHVYAYELSDILLETVNE